MYEGACCWVAGFETAIEGLGVLCAFGVAVPALPTCACCLLRRSTLGRKPLSSLSSSTARAFLHISSSSSSMSDSDSLMVRTSSRGLRSSCHSSFNPSTFSQVCDSARTILSREDVLSQVVFVGREGADNVEGRIPTVDANGGGPCGMAGLEVVFFDTMSSFAASSSPWSWIRSSSRRTISSTGMRMRSSLVAQEGDFGLRFASGRHWVVSLWLRSRIEGVTSGARVTFADCHGSGAGGGEEL